MAPSSAVGPDCPHRGRRGGIRRTNFDDSLRKADPLSPAIADREITGPNRDLLAQVAEQASTRQEGCSSSEVRLVASVSVADLKGKPTSSPRPSANSARGLTQHFASIGLGKHEALATAYAQIYQAVQAQAASLAYIDTFMVLCVAAGIMFFLSFALQKNDPGGGGVRPAE